MKNFLDRIAEISFDYTDDNGVTHVDAYTINPDEEGRTLGYIVGNEFYPKDNKVLSHQKTMGIIKEHTSTDFKFGSCWSKADIQGRAKEMGVTLTDAECKEIADNIERTHDANIGINWEVIDENIRFYKGL